MALSAVVALFPAQWQIRVLKENVAALQFWQSAVSHLVGDDYVLSEEIDLEMHFSRFHGEKLLKTERRCVIPKKIIQAWFFSGLFCKVSSLLFMSQK